MPAQMASRSLGAMNRALLSRPVSVPGVTLPPGMPNRPLGQEWFADGMDALLGGLGINNPLDPKASSATQIGGMLSAAIPLSMFGKVGGVGRAAADLERGFTLPKPRALMTEAQMNAFLAGHGGTQGTVGQHLGDVAKGVTAYYGPSLAMMGRQ